MLRAHGGKVQELRREVENVKARFKKSVEKNNAVFQQVESLEARKNILEFDVGLPSSPSRVHRPSEMNKPVRRAVSTRRAKARKSPKEREQALGDWLVKSGKISLEQLGKAVGAMKEEGTDLVAACLRLGYIDKQTAEQARKKEPGLK
ncbi:MAG: hypothetical protein ACOCVM_08320 [Desulfovibrionaceae bacterium]